ncbi:MAG TPA: PD-(D/E)XK nuclease family protein, partial [Nitrospirales bacterium]
WDYRDKVEVLLEQSGRNSADWQPEGFQGDFEEVLAEARDIVRAFTHSEAYADLRDSTILGQEIPFIMPWQPPPTLMEGRIDLLYEKDGQVWVADYKTDRVTESEIAERVEKYQPQARIYTEAVRQTLGRTTAGFTLIFLRLGKSVPCAYIVPTR